MKGLETELGFQMSSLVELFAPISLEEFFSKYWLKSHLYCPGPRDKFSKLISWPVVNQLLEHHWRETYRFRLLQQGKTVHFDSYADPATWGGTPKIRSKDLTNLLRRGATLDFDAIDELHPPLNSLARSLESFFRASSKINIYAGWSKAHGLDLHRDDQDNFILQIDGHKRWLLYGYSIEGIDKTELETTSIPPEGAQFDKVIKPGDLLYIPRDCYHLAVPQNEPTFHLTVSVKNRLGRHLLVWITEKLAATEFGMRDVPRFATPEEQATYIEGLRTQLLDCLTPDLLEKYFDQVDGAFKARPSFSLPWSATHEGLPEGSDFRVLLTVGRYLNLGASETSEALEFSCHGKEWRFPVAMKIIIDRLNGDRSLPMSQLINLSSDTLNEQTVRTLTAMLVKNGLAAIQF